MTTFAHTQRGACPVCGTRDWQEFLRTTTGRIMTGDQRVLPGALWKIRCIGCGTVANGRPFPADELRRMYSDEYELNTTGHEEHLFFTPAGPVPRSALFLDRIAPHLPAQVGTLLEIGCGEGNLLARLADHMPHARLRGIEGSARAVKLAQSRGLDVTQGLVMGDLPLPAADVIVCINVVEHVEDPADFLRRLRAALRPGGRIIFSLPVQDNFSYDLFFHEHVWHFDQAHACTLLESNGLRVVATDCNHPDNRLMGLYVCEADPTGPRAARSWRRGASAASYTNRDAWLSALQQVEDWLGRRPGARLAVFGGGEVLALFCAFTSLGERTVLACLDEDPNKIGTRRQGIPVQPVEWLADHDVDGVLITANPVYHDRISSRLEPYVPAQSRFTWNVLAPQPANAV